MKKAQAALVLGRPPRAESLTDYYYLYYATVALIRADRAAFARWNGKVKAALAAYQKADGGFGGRSRYSEYGGRALTTALAALALEAYFRGE